MTEEQIERLEIAVNELADIQEDISDEDHRCVIGWATHYFRSAIVEIKRLHVDMGGVGNDA